MVIQTTTTISSIKGRLMLKKSRFVSECDLYSLLMRMKKFGASTIRKIKSIHWTITCQTPLTPWLSQGIKSIMPSVQIRICNLKSISMLSYEKRNCVEDTKMPCKLKVSHLIVYGPESKTPQIYNAVVRPITKGALCGYNGTVFMHGQTTLEKHIPCLVHRRFLESYHVPSETYSTESRM